MSDTIDIAKARSEASDRYRSKVCAECRWISTLGRCQQTGPRYASIVIGKEACEDFKS